jgi:hypothetical protein
LDSDERCIISAIPVTTSPDSGRLTEQTPFAVRPLGRQRNLSEQANVGALGWSRGRRLLSGDGDDPPTTQFFVAWTSTCGVKELARRVRRYG